MVASASVLKHTFQDDIDNNIIYANIPQTNVKWCTVSLADVLKAKKRLEAAVFDVDAKHARDVIANCIWESIPFPKILSKAYYPGRFKRIYSDSKSGVPFYLPSQMTNIYPKPDKYISALTKCDISELRLKYGDVLLTRSGTVGNVTIVTKTLENTVFSDDVIRITPNDNIAGYIYAYLSSNIGRTILQTNRYGSVIQHIEPEHLAEITIPNPPDEIKTRINDLIMQSFELRDKSNELIDSATDMLIKALKLPALHELVTSRFNSNTDINNYNVKLSELSGRFDGSYHVPIVLAIKDHLHKHAAEVTTVGDKKITTKIILAGVFKRVYVAEEYGIPFLGGKEITQLSPKTEKFLSRPHHQTRYKKELRVSENMVLVTDRGSIATIALVPKHWEGMAVSQNVLKLIPATKEITGYLYIFLNSCYGNALIQRQTYGSVVDMIDNNSMADVEFPLLKDINIQAEINRLALEANDLRYKAYQLEQDAMKILNGEVLFA